MLDCQCKHEFSDNNARTALTGAPPKELRWPLCTGWTLGWCRMLPMLASIPSYGCCPVVVDQCFMLSHTQCNHSPTWSKQWPGTASEVGLGLLPTSNEQPLEWGWETPCTVSLAHWYALYEWDVQVPPQPKELCWLLHWQKCVSNPHSRGIWVQDRGAVKCTTLHLWATNLKPFLVAHSCMAFTACCKYLAMVFRERPQNRLSGHQQRVLWRCPWQYKRAAH